MNPSFMTVVI